ncbi:sodium:alanine symporter, partial [Stenotrophomonas maltophilia]
MEATLHVLNRIIWSTAPIFMCLAAGLFFSLRTRFLQSRGFLARCRRTVKGETSDAGGSSVEALAMS